MSQDGCHHISLVSHCWVLGPLICLATDTGASSLTAEFGKKTGEDGGRVQGRQQLNSPAKVGLFKTQCLARVRGHFDGSSLALALSSWLSRPPHRLKLLSFKTF